jgi:hypothetical protein
VLNMRQRRHVSWQQRQARPRMDDQVVAGAVVPPDGLAMHESWQAGSCIPLKHTVRMLCTEKGTMSLHCVQCVHVDSHQLMADPSLCLLYIPAHTTPKKGRVERLPPNI